jgi:hypothetical protein
MENQFRIPKKTSKHNGCLTSRPIRQKDKPMALQKFLSTLHALLLSTFGLLYLPQFWNSEISVAYECSKDAHIIKMATMTFTGYLITDIIIGIWKNTIKLEVFFHHVLFASVAIIQMYYERSCLPFTWMITGELSTIFLNIRWYLISTGRSYGLGIINALFVLTFFVTRCLLYGWGLLRFWLEDPNIRSHEWSVWLLVTPSFFSLGYVLNLWWFSKIIEKILDMSKKD